ncbi:MAG: hypothetical protein ACQPRI_06200 [Solitalea-like symbiont of Tyrophagus putrescentiae]
MAKTNNGIYFSQFRTVAAQCKLKVLKAMVALNLQIARYINYWQKLVFVMQTRELKKYVCF